MPQESFLTEPMRRWRRWTDGPLLVIAIGSLPLLLLEIERSQLTAADRRFLDVVNVVVFAAFAVDYGVELVMASDRRAYARAEWINGLIVVTSGVAVVPSLAAAGGLRVLRGVPALRAVAGVARLVAIGHGCSYRTRSHSSPSCVLRRGDGGLDVADRSRRFHAR